MNNSTLKSVNSCNLISTMNKNEHTRFKMCLRGEVHKLV